MFQIPIVKHLLWGGAAMLSFLLTACPGPKGPVDVEVLDYDTSTGHWRLATSTLETVTDLNILTGKNFDIVGNQVVIANGATNLDPDVSEEEARDAMYDRRGDAVQFSYDWVTDNSGKQIAVANDYESLAMVTVFHHYEKVWSFYENTVKDKSGATDRATLVGFYGTLAGSIGIPIPISTADNAAYVPLADSWVVLRNALLDGIPLPLNSGVIAHEFSHRVFHHNVYEGPAYENWFQEVVKSSTMSEDAKRTFILLKALDEGCADINGVGFIGRADFIADSLKGALGESTSVQRDLEGEFADWATYTTLKDSGWDYKGNDVCVQPSTDYSDTEWNFYCLGTVWARTLWDASGRDIEVLRESMLPALNRALPEVGKRLGEQWLFDFDIVLQALAEEVPADLHTPLCDAYREKFDELLPWVTSCP